MSIVFFFEKKRKKTRERFATREEVDSKKKKNARRLREEGDEGEMADALLLFCGPAHLCTHRREIYSLWRETKFSAASRIPELLASEFLVVLFCDFTLEL